MRRNDRRLRPGLAALLCAAVCGATTWGACAEPRAARMEAAASWPATRAQALALPPPRGPAEHGPAAHPLTAVDGRREGGALVLADAGSRRLALIADEDAAALRVVDRRTHAQLAVAPLPGRPGQVAVGADGRAYVALRDQQQVVAFELAGNDGEAHHGEALALQQAGQLTTAVEPIGLAMSPDGDTLLVASGWGRRLQGLSLADGDERFSVALAREPRSVVVSDDGKTAFVSHARGPAISRVALNDDGQPVTALKVAGKDQQMHRRSIRSCFGGGCFLPGDPLGRPIRRRPRRAVRFVAGPVVRRHAVQGFALASFQGDAVAPLVLARTGAEERPVGGYGTAGEGFAAHQPVLAHVYRAIDEVMVRGDGRVFAASVPQASATTLGPQGCLLPRAIAVDERRALALVGCAGNDQVIAYRLDGDPLVDAMQARWRVPAGPLGIAVDAAAGEALVWSQFAGKLARVQLPAERKRKPWQRGFGSEPKFTVPQQISTLPRIDRSEDGLAQLSQAALRGRALFHGAGDARISRDGRACASCHPDGREDGITWPSPQGKSQTPMLAGRVGADTAPYGWNGESDTVADHLAHTFKRLGGRGLPGDDLAALLAYLQEMPGPPRDHQNGAGAADDVGLVARGKSLFEQDTVGCAVCHKQGVGSDGAVHDVGSGRRLDTPSLRFISGTGPYFHDGRYATLMDVLRETKGKMGWGADLSDADLQALHAYLLTL